ncbi:MAG: MaoC/PaaZ C-terminal domain-containing protein [Chloroflexota bacterium]
MAGQLFYEDVEVGMEIPPLTKHPTPMQLVKWAGASGDYNPIHYNQDAAIAQNLPGIIVHGRLKSAFLCQLLTDWIGERGRLVKIGCQHRGMDVSDRDLVCKGKVTGKSTKDGGHLVECEVWVENDKGQKTAPGTATVALPSKEK